MFFCTRTTRAPSLDLASLLPNNAVMRNAPQKNENGLLVLTTADLAKHLGISQRHLHTLAKSGKVPEPIRLGHSVRWPRPQIETWLAAGAPDRQAWEAMKRA